MSNKRPSATSKTSTSKTFKADPAYDADVAKSAYTELLPTYNAMDPAEVMHVTADPELMAITAIGVSARLAKDPLQDEMKTLPKDHFDPAAVALLPKAAWGLRYAVLATAKARAQSSEAAVPPDLVQRASEIEGRMQRCCEYHLSDEVAAMSELDRLRPGTGYRDVANDLLGYAALYETFDSILSKDTKNYRATDRADAIAVSNQIIEALAAAMGPDEVGAGDTQARAATYLLNIYEEVASAGRWIRRKSADVDSLFPSLIASGRAAAKRAKAVEEDPTDATAKSAATTSTAPSATNGTPVATTAATPVAAKPVVS